MEVDLDDEQNESRTTSETSTTAATIEIMEDAAQQPGDQASTLKPRIQQQRRSDNKQDKRLL